MRVQRVFPMLERLLDIDMYVPMWRVELANHYIHSVGLTSIKHI